MQKVVLATGNPGKVKELASLLSDFGLDIVAQTELSVDSVEETGLTFVENALIKARHAAKVTGLPAIADDSGISVDALGGAPGIYSARYAGVDASDQQNLDKLLDAMKDVPAEKRQAQFNCVLVYMR
ncbi:nucleoside-triphosphate diphosphatase, partial [Proteus mirabilis]